MKATILAAALGAGAALAGYAMRKEILRYVTIKRVGSNPDVVGRSITPQGNQRALGSTDEERREDRRSATSRPVGQAMPDLQPGDQAG